MNAVSKRNELLDSNCVESCSTKPIYICGNWTFPTNFQKVSLTKNIQIHGYVVKNSTYG